MPTDLLIQVTIQLKMGLITEPDGKKFKFLDHVDRKISPLHTHTPFISSWHMSILYGSNSTTFVSFCNSILHMLNYWDARRVEVVG